MTQVSLGELQQEMREAYAGGGPGAIVSSLVWLVAAIIHNLHGPQAAYAALFVGGMAIYPLSTLACSVLLARPAPSRGNPLGALALESTVAMIAGLLVAWMLLSKEPQFAFPLAAIAVGARYFVFHTVYADRAFWVLGAAIALTGFAALYLPGFGDTAMIVSVAITEMVAGLWLTVRDRR